MTSFSKTSLLYRSARMTTWVASLLWLSGCAVGPDYVRPSLDMPDQYKRQITEPAEGWKKAEPADDQAKGMWWSIFNDKVLDDLMQQLLENNQNIQVAYANYQKSQAAISSAQAAYFPTLGITGSSTRSGTFTTTSNSNTLKGTVSWELDIWGKVSRSSNAAKDQALASKATLQNAQLSAQATLAQAYYNLRVADRQIELVDQTIAAYQRSLQITQNQLSAGIITPLDVAQAKTTLSNIQKQKLAYQLSREQYEHAIAVLVGQAPANFSLAKSDYLPAVPTVPNTIPSQLLERRPDIAVAERTAMAANEQIGVAKAAYFPTLGISANGGYTKSIIEGLINPANLAWSLGASLAETIFDGGAKIAAVRQAKAGYQSSVAQYRQTVLNAMQEVEDNLSAVEILKQETQYQKDSLASAQQADKLAHNQYLAGVIDYTTVVVNQSAFYTAQSADLQLLSQRYTAVIGLVKAVGGDLR